MGKSPKGEHALLKRPWRLESLAVSHTSLNVVTLGCSVSLVPLEMLQQNDVNCNNLSFGASTELCHGCILLGKWGWVLEESHSVSRVLSWWIFQEIIPLQSPPTWRVLKNGYDKYGFYRDLTISPSDSNGPEAAWGDAIESHVSMVYFLSAVLHDGLNQVEMYWLDIREAVQEAGLCGSLFCGHQESNFTHYSFIKSPEVSVLVMHQYYDNTDADCVQSTSPKQLQAIGVK